MLITDVGSGVRKMNHMVFLILIIIIIMVFLLMMKKIRIY